MSTEETGGFLARWSRRKKAASREIPAAESPPELPPPELPPIESLGADSDYTVFLARDVSRVLQAQALRVAWTSDPAIANFRGMADYDWDFNAPGYGDLAPGDDAATWLSQVVRSGASLLTQEASAAPSPLAATTIPPAPIAEKIPAERVTEATIAAPETAEKNVAAPVRRRHGGAMPV